MSEEMNLVRDLAVILVSAGIFTIIARALKQPLILGYILAGFLVGPNIDFFPGIKSAEAVSQWSEIGMIFMMFALGLEFSFKKLMRVGSSALVTAGVKFIGVFVLGFVTAQALQWTVMESIFLGGLLSMSSTMVVLKSYEDMGMKDRPYAAVVFGTLVVEDLIAILLMVLLSTMAVSRTFAGKEMLMNIAKLVFFLLLWFLVGIYLIPTLLKKAKRYLNDEILLIVSIGLCFGMVSLATAVGFSSALGAFVMGSIFAETTESEDILKVVTPIKYLFSAIFFVSVGMMISPQVIVQHWAIIILLAVLVVVSHILFAGAGIIITGGGYKNALYTGFSLAQLGEFGFIIAGVGVNLGVMRDFIYPVIIAVSVITTFTTPFMIRLAGPACNFFEKRLPSSWKERLSPADTSAKSTAVEKSEWSNLLKAYFLRILLYGVILVAIYIGSKVYLGDFLTKLLPQTSEKVRNLINVTVTLAVMAPFLYGLGISSGSINSSAPKLIKEKKSNVWPLAGLVVTRSFIAIAFVLGVISTYFNLSWWTLVAIVAAGLLFIIAARHSVHRLSSIEYHFLHNYNEKEESERKARPVASSVRQNLSDYDVYTSTFTLGPESSYAGVALKDIPIREISGANIIKITRGRKNIIVPSGDEVLFPGDVILAVGTTEQNRKLKEMMDASVAKSDGSEEGSFHIKPVTVNENSFVTGKTMRSLNLRKFHCMVISVLHGDEFITNPEPDYRFSPGDTVWVAGNTDALGWAV